MALNKHRWRAVLCHLRRWRRRVDAAEIAAAAAAATNRKRINVVVFKSVQSGSDRRGPHTRGVLRQRVPLDGATVGIDELVARVSVAIFGVNPPLLRLGRSAAARSSGFLRSERRRAAVLLMHSSDDVMARRRRCGRGCGSGAVRCQRSRSAVSLEVCNGEYQPFFLKLPHPKVLVVIVGQVGKVSWRDRAERHQRLVVLRQTILLQKLRKAGRREVLQAVA